MINGAGVQVGAWVKIGDTTRLDYRVFRDGTVELCVGEDDALMLVTTEHGLRRLLVHADAALRAVQGAIAGNSRTPQRTSSRPPSSQLPGP